MTDAELEAIEADFRHTPTSMLVAEVRRLRGLVKRVEYRGSSGPAWWYTVCSWCSACSSDGSKPPHDADCPAFTESGAVR